jgi:hypothetical protein
MNPNRKYIILILLLTIGTFFACFREDERIEPHEPGSEVIVALEENIYYRQVFINLSPDTADIVQINDHGEWHLGFESADTGWHILLNSADYLRIANTGISNFEEVTSIPPDIKWTYDRSDGDLDSTAVDQWVTPGEAENIYTNHVYLLGTFGGINYTIFRKVVFLELSEEKYVFKAAKLDGSDEQTYELFKDENYDFLRFSFHDGGKITPQPERYNWDFMLGQYATIIFTNDGIPTEYTVRGALINSTGVEVAIDSTMYFRDIVLEDVQDMEFTDRIDIIGHEWKAYIEPDYVIDTLYNYIIRDADGLSYKLKFTGYYSSAISEVPPQKGYPTFEYKEL